MSNNAKLAVAVLGVLVAAGVALWLLFAAIAPRGHLPGIHQHGLGPVPVRELGATA
jgi:hypothetical protein